MDLAPRIIGELLALTQGAIDQLVKLPKYPREKNSGYLTVRRKSDGKVLLIACFGECPADKVNQRLALSQEKGHRLFVGQEVFHVSSFQSRDGVSLWGGAIVAGDFILSFSGLPELADEAVVLYVARALEWISPDNARIITEISLNPYLKQIRPS